MPPRTGTDGGPALATEAQPLHQLPHLRQIPVLQPLVNLERLLRQPPPEALTKVAPVGNVSLTTTLLSGTLPVLVTTSVKSAVPPGQITGTLTDFARSIVAISASGNENEGAFSPTLSSMLFS